MDVEQEISRPFFLTLAGLGMKSAAEIGSIDLDVDIKDGVRAQCDSPANNAYLVTDMINADGNSLKSVAKYP